MHKSMCTHKNIYGVNKLSMYEILHPSYSIWAGQSRPCKRMFLFFTTYHIRFIAGAKEHDKMRKNYLIQTNIVEDKFLLEILTNFSKVFY
jgi:hypothetical protein